MLEDVLREEIKTISENLTAGSVSDYPHYKYQAGKAAGLQLALDRCEDVATEIAKRFE